ncbi:MAG: serine hydrolase [Bacteroidota bacterium]
MTKALLLLLTSLICLTCFAQQNANTENLIYKVLDDNGNKLLKGSKAYSVSIGIVKDGKTYTKHFGEIEIGTGKKATNETLFEIASVTKVFTGLLMAKAVLEKKINLEDDIRKYITGSYPNLEFAGNPIRIKDMVSFKTGLDRDLPDNIELRKNENDSTAFYCKKLDESYSKMQFFQDLKTVKLDTLPGTVYTYSNLSLQLSAHILENVYHKSYEILLKENILSKAGMTSTQLNIPENEKIANGYNGNHILMPHFSNNLWGSQGLLKSTLNDLTKFLLFELDKKNRFVQESQRNVLNSNQNWYGYFWDGIEVVDNGKFCHKHGGAYGTQTMFVVYPELNLGISIIVNISAPNTYDFLFNTVLEIAEDLKPESKTDKKLYGYKLSNDKVVFTYTYPMKLDASLIKKVSIAGSFNNWNPQDNDFQMVSKGHHIFELEFPKTKFEKGKTYVFKFVINTVGWTTTPKNALNVQDGEDRNLTFKIE